MFGLQSQEWNQNIDIIAKNVELLTEKWWNKYYWILETLIVKDYKNYMSYFIPFQELQ